MIGVFNSSIKKLKTSTYLYMVNIFKYFIPEKGAISEQKLMQSDWEKVRFRPIISQVQNIRETAKFAYCEHEPYSAFVLE